LYVIGQLYDEHHMITQWIWNQTNNTTQKTKDWLTFKTRDEIMWYMLFLLVCCIEASLAIAGLIGIIWQKVYDSLGQIRWNDRPLHKLTWDPAYTFRNWWYICVFTDSSSIFLTCVRVHCILCNLLLLFYYLTFQETIKNQLEGNYGGMMFNATNNNSPVISWRSVILFDKVVVSKKSWRWN
jgi:hypothetical protein